MRMVRLILIIAVTIGVAFGVFQLVYFFLLL